MFRDFLDKYRAKSTRALYVSAWVKFLSLAYGARLAGASPEILEPWVAKYANDLRNGRRDLDTDFQALGEAIRAPKTLQAYRSAIRTVLAGANIPLPREGRRQPARPKEKPPLPAGGEALTAGRILRLLEHLDTRGRAILYVLVSSGARPGEVLSLRLGDLDLESRPARFQVRDSSGRATRVAFLSREAVGAIRVYLIVRDRFLSSARSRGGSAGPDRLFPLGPRAFGEIWGLALERARLAGPGPAGGRRALTPRAARRFFEGQVGMVLPGPVVAALLGKPGRAPRYTDEELAAAYLEGEQAVTLHRRHGKERMARRVAELERLVRLLGDEGRERDREIARIREILHCNARGGQAGPEGGTGRL
ncbi:MAG TPA: site-specific integrase [Methanomicrobiales archaeon]|nr:site-specific integrase [Methanomicrobiales archaeon]